MPPSDPWYQLTAVESYRQLHEWIRDAFFRRGVSCELASQGDPAGPGQCFIGWEKYDLVRAGKKIGGAAQRRKRLGLLIQGSIQPTPKELPRADWQRAMIQCVPNSGSPPTIDRLEGKIYDRLIHRTAELVSIRYSNEEYQQKR